jgi:hypothetical protein
MTELLEQAIAKLKTRPIREQDSRSILNENLSCRSSSYHELFTMLCRIVIKCVNRSSVEQ